MALPQCDRLYVCADLLGLSQDAAHALLALGHRRRQGVSMIEDQDLAALGTLVMDALLNVIYGGESDNAEALLNLCRYRFEVVPQAVERLGLGSR